MGIGSSVRAAVLASLLVVAPGAPSAEPVAVRYLEGVARGFLSLRSPDGRALASGDLIQNVRGDRVTSRLIYRFKDGSLSDDTAVFSQRGHFRLIREHLIQRGPTFDQPIDMTIDGAAGRVVVRYTNSHGEEKVEDEHMDLPPDLANGLLITLLKNVRATALPPSVSFLAATPKPRLVKLKISAAGREPFSVAGSTRHAMHYVIKVDIGGIAGMVAPLVGKQPDDSHVWVMDGEAPAFVRSRAPMFNGGPLWQTDLVSPVWPRN